MKIVWPRVPAAFSERKITLRVRLPTCGRNSSAPFTRARAAMVVGERRRERDRAVGDRGDGQLFPLRLVVLAALVLAQLARVGNHELVADVPAGHGFGELQRGVARHRLSRQTHERRALRGARYRHRAETHEASAQLLRIHLRVDRDVGADELRGDVAGNRPLRCAHLERPALQHGHRPYLDARVRIGAEGQRALDVHALQRRIADDVIRHSRACRDMNGVACSRYPAGGPGGGIRPCAICDRRHVGLCAELRDPVGDAARGTMHMPLRPREGGRQQQRATQGQDGTNSRQRHQHLLGGTNGLTREGLARPLI